MVDPLTVKITYDTPWVTLLDALRRTPIWSPTAAEKFGLANFSKNLVGAGPFTLGEWVPMTGSSSSSWADYGGWNPIQIHKGPVDVDHAHGPLYWRVSVLGTS